MVNLLDNIIFLIFSVQCVCNTHPKIVNIATDFYASLSSPSAFGNRNFQPKPDKYVDSCTFLHDPLAQSLD